MSGFAADAFGDDMDGPTDADLEEVEDNEEMSIMIDYAWMLQCNDVTLYADIERGPRIVLASPHRIISEAHRDWCRTP